MNDELSLKDEWGELLTYLGQLIGKRPSDLNTVLFLIGIQELGKGPIEFTKEQKQDLMHIAVCKLLSLEGYYTLEGHDQDGWPHWKLTEKVPYATLIGQEATLKSLAIRYFRDEV